MAICGIAKKEGLCESGTALIGKILSAMDKRAKQVHTGHSGQTITLGVASSLNIGSAHSSDLLLVVCDAEIYNRNELPVQRLRDSATPADIIAELYLGDGIEFLKQLRGVFSIAIW